MRLFFERGLRYFAIGFGTFGVDLALLFFFIDTLGWEVLFSTAVAFVGALTLNYFLARRYVFLHSDRGVLRGYVYFITIALLGMGATVSLMWALLEYTAFHYALSRLLIAIFVGVANYFANLFFNFKVVGQELRSQESIAKGLK